MKHNLAAAVLAFLTVVFSLSVSDEAQAQTEFTTWGNLTGIRVDGQLMPFETSVCIIDKDKKYVRKTARERQGIKFSKNEGSKTFEYDMHKFSAIETIKDLGKGRAEIAVEYASQADTSLYGAFFRIDLPLKYYERGQAKLGKEKVSLSTLTSSSAKNVAATTDHLIFTSGDVQLEVTFAEAAEVTVSGADSAENSIPVYIRMLPGQLKKGQSAKNSFTFKVDGKIDRSPVHISLQPSNPGRPFAGIGGNFRLQNPKTDPQVIDYSLENLRVAWGRVEMPWKFWQPDENMDPIAEARAGRLHPKVKAAMEMAQRLSKMGIPVIVSAWTGPDWAIEGDPNYGRQADGTYGNPLDASKTDKIYKSIADYMQYLKEEYGVEARMFSFNESDLGINIRQTAAEHQQLIKGLGAYFASRGLKTKLLLGDTADVNGWSFVYEAMKDRGILPYTGAISFHSWRGYSEENLEKWHAAAKKLNLPLIVGEGSIDAGAWRYPDIFEEPTYAREEIDLYVKILNICEPLSILQWQLTADYSAMSGGGIFGNDNEPLHPAQRFWNLKQLGATSANLLHIPVTVEKTNITCAALRSEDNGRYAVHMVNNGAERKVEIAGLPGGIETMKIYVTNSQKEMEEAGTVAIVNGTATFTMPSASFISLMNGN